MLVESETVNKDDLSQAEAIGRQQQLTNAQNRCLFSSTQYVSRPMFTVGKHCDQRSY